jgi:hypothetical protein
MIGKAATGGRQHLEANARSVITTDRWTVMRDKIIEGMISTFVVLDGASVQRIGGKPR